MLTHQKNGKILRSSRQIPIGTCSRAHPALLSKLMLLQKKRPPARLSSLVSAAGAARVKVIALRAVRRVVVNCILRVWVRNIGVYSCGMLKMGYGAAVRNES